MTDLLERAFRDHYGQVYRYLRRRTGDPERAEDLAQQVFADAATALPGFGEDAPSPLAWLYTVAHRRFVDETRRRASRPELPVTTATDYGDDVKRALVTAFGRLPEEQRTVLALKLLRGARFKEIAASLGIGEGAAKMRFVRALQALRTELEHEGVEP